MRLITSIPVLLYLLTSCTERFEPQVEGGESLLVVDGLVTDQVEEYTIKLSRSVSLGALEKVPVTDAQVNVSDSQGESYLFHETQPGVYQSNPQTFVGVAGNSYTLQILTAEGVLYQSEAVALKVSPGIDSLYHERQIRLTDEGDSLDGLKILVDSHDMDAATRYYRYSWIESYEVRPRYPSFYYYDPNSNPVFALRDIRLNLCYASDTSSHILVTNTNQFSDDRVTGFELTYVSTDGYRLNSLYSILVRQYVLDENAFKYWSEMEKVTASLGTIFDPFPYPITGNVHRPDKKDELVLGYFSVSGVTDKRLFISREELPELSYPEDPCKAELRYPQTPEEFFLFLTWGYMIVDVTGGLWGPPECTDCREHGVLEKPGFWP